MDGLSGKLGALQPESGAARWQLGQGLVTAIR